MRQRACFLSHAVPIKSTDEEQLCIALFRKEIRPIFGSSITTVILEKSIN